jgi:regulator of nucleoside diphosphate kinase
MTRRAREAVDNARCGHVLERPPIVLTASDRDRLSSLLRAAVATVDVQASRFLREELDRADIVCGEVSPTAVVSIGSTVKFIDHNATSIREVKLVHPKEANDLDLISVTGNLGSALVGLGPGQTIRWHDDKIERRTTVLETIKSR